MQSNTADVYVRARRAGGFREKLCLVPFLGVFKGMPGLTVTRAIALNFALLEPRTSRSNRIRLLWEDSSKRVHSSEIYLSSSKRVRIWNKIEHGTGTIRYAKDSFFFNSLLFIRDTYMRYRLIKRNIFPSFCKEKITPAHFWISPMFRKYCPVKECCIDHRAVGVKSAEELSS